MRILAAIFLLFAHTLTAQVAPFEQDIWLGEAGVNVRVNDMVADPAGGFWLATDDGVRYFNGRSTAPASDTIRNVTTLINTAGGLIYGCRDGAVYKYEDGDRKLLLRSSMPVLCLQQGYGGILVGTEGDGIYLVSGSYGVLHFSLPQGVPDDYIYTIDKVQGTYLAGTDLDLFKGRPAVSKGLYFEEIQHFGDITRVIKNVPAGNAAVWVGFQERGVAFIAHVGQTGEHVTRTEKEDWNWGQVNDILPDGPQRCWVVTESGWLLQASAYNNAIHTDTVLHISRPISSIEKDRMGNIWLGTGKGLTKVTAGWLSGVRVQPDFRMQELTALEYVAGRGLYYNQDNELWQYDAATGKYTMIHAWATAVNCLYADNAGRLWVGTSGSGLWCDDGKGAFRQVDAVPGIDDAYFLNISGYREHLWLSTLNGVEEMITGEGGNTTFKAHYGKSTGLGSDIVYQIFTDRRGRTWFGTDGAGLCMYDGRSMKCWGQGSGFRSGVIYDIAEDSYGNIWAATLEDGLLCYNGKGWRRFTRKDGLQSETINSLETDLSGRVYAASAKGIDIWHPAALTFRHVNAATGRGLDSFSSSLNILTRSLEGGIYVVHKAGFLLFKDRPFQDIRPGLKLTGVDLFFQHLAELPSKLHYDQNHITFKFQGINLATTERLHYRYRLEGLNADWISTSDQFVTYPRLPPGKYTFEIQASVNEGFNNPAQARWQFRIVPPFWKTVWFWALVLLVTACGIYLFIRWRVRSVQQLSVIKQERVMFEYEHLKSQVNPHFLFNSLNTLAALIEEHPEGAVAYTEQLSELYRDTLSEHREPLITISEEWKMLERYYFIQHTRFGAALQLKDLLPPDVKVKAKVVPLALQLLMENAIKHNIVSRSMPLIVVIETDGQSIIIRNPVQYKKHKEKGLGIGLKNIRRRYSLVTSRPVDAFIQNDEFIVKLPLII